MKYVKQLLIILAFTLVGEVLARVIPFPIPAAIYGFVLLFVALCTGASWLCYYKALQLGDASKVVPIDKLSVVITLILAFAFLHEKLTVKSIIGGILITLGTLIMVL